MKRDIEDLKQELFSIIISKYYREDEKNSIRNIYGAYLTEKYERILVVARAELGQEDVSSLIETIIDEKKNLGRLFA